MRADIPLNLDERHREEALRLRNQLLLYRLRNFKSTRSAGRAPDSGLEPRLEQIFGPLLSVVGDEGARARIRGALRSLNDDIEDDRAESVEAEVLMVIRDLVARGPSERLAIQDITNEFASRYGAAYEKRITPRWIGSIVRRRLGLKPSRSTGMFTLGPEDVAQLGALYRRFGLLDSYGKSAEEALSPEGGSP